jgi:hypothetical protein
MTIQSHTGEFKCFIDAMYYGFQWKEAQYIDVEFTAVKRDDEVVASVQTIKAQPWLIGSITIRGNWMEVSKLIEAATLDHATKHFRNSHVDKTVMAALAPHI